MKKSELQPEESAIYFHRYLNKINDETALIEGFETSKKEVVRFFASIPASKLDYRYQAEKWSVKEVLQHLIDTERVFLYRCFRLGRQDDTNLASFNQDDFIVPSGAAHKSIEKLLEEYVSTRNHFISLLKSFTKENLCFIGNCSTHPLSARAAAFIVLGHELWHIDIIKERYL